jgi:hypothetical protein
MTVVLSQTEIRESRGISVHSNHHEDVLVLVERL